MISLPPSSRNQLKWYRFENTGERNWKLVLPTYYAELCNEQMETILPSRSVPWYRSSTGKTLCAFLKQIDNEDEERIRRFIADYEQFVVIGAPKKLPEYLHDAVDSCLALDYNYPNPEAARKKMHTPVGKLVYKIKYGDEHGLTGTLASQLASAFDRIPLNGYGKEYVVSFIPSADKKGYDLPQQLATDLVALIGGHDFVRAQEPLVQPELVGSKPSFKDLAASDKFEEWSRIFSNDRVSLTQSVKDCVVYVIDDLYQSGSTLWSYARFLKSMGAGAVRGLVCEKSLRDGDNR